MPWDFALILIFLAVLVPLKGHARIRKLLAKSQVDATERLQLYGSTIAYQWAVVAIVAWRCYAHRLNPEELGLLSSNRPRILLVALLGGAILFGLQWLNLRRMGNLPPRARGPLHAIASRILPQSRLESLVFFALAVTAALCEEFLYRGFAMAALMRSGWSNVPVVLSTAILFALGHLYQGKGGFAGTLILGLVFGEARVAFGSILPMVVWHGSIDVVAALAGKRYLIDSGMKG